MKKPASSFQPPATAGFEDIFSTRSSISCRRPWRGTDSGIIHDYILKGLIPVLLLAGIYIAARLYLSRKKMDRGTEKLSEADVKAVEPLGLTKARGIAGQSRISYVARIEPNDVKVIDMVRFDIRSR